MTLENILEAKQYLEKIVQVKPEIAIILGSGLSPLADRLEDSITIPYKDIPHFPVSTVKGHKGNLIVGKIKNKYVLCMQGRFHYYEGYTMQQVTFPIRVMQMLGIKTLIVTNAAGGVNKSFKAGDIMLITDHISRMPNPLIGPNEETLGERFPSMTNIYDKNLRQLALEFAQNNNITLKQGIYVGNTGPSFETDAEYIMFRQLGISAVGMSTVPEVIVAAHAKMKVLGFSVISNVFNEDILQEPTHEEVLENVSLANVKLIEILEGVIPKID
ncbi:MAG: purine-nucleoside phosphorylase [Bacteroidales bacterium]|nr:purine-nucleoside phosphorylase [Bacteroidales bacterium]